MIPSPAPRWERVKNLVGAALEKTPAERAAFVEEACEGDAPLRDEVQALLTAHMRAGTFLQSHPRAEKAETLLVPGTRVGPYEIVALLGTGGMGRVYRARDTRLGREVAIKFLASGRGDEKQLQRFEQEARAAGSLAHPNVLVVHDVGALEGEPYIVTELLQGTTLRERMAGGPLPAAEALGYAVQLAQGLCAAHEKGIVHRDLKPENLFVTAQAWLKILDFGIAKLVESAGGPGFVTTEGAVIGTVDYMSPEQVCGRPADARSDIFSCGTILYEMASGRRPFERESAAETGRAIVSAEPPPLGQEPLERVVRRCLAKDPRARYQTAHDLAAELEALRTPHVAARARPLVAIAAAAMAVTSAALGYMLLHGRAAAPSSRPPTGRVMLAVLPFENLSGDPEQEYFSDGLTEETIAELGGMQPARLGVIARTSVMPYKKTAKRVDQIGRELGVDYLLEGSVRRAGDQVRVTAQLIEVSGQTHLWAENYQQRLANALAIQSDLAQRISHSLAIELLPAQQERLARARPVIPEAYEAYLKGRYYQSKRDIKKSLEYFQQALAADASFASAYGSVAVAYAMLGDPLFGWVSPKETYAQARAAAEKALELDPSVVEAHLAQALIEGRYDWNWAGAERELARALELNPSDATAHQYYALHLTRMGRTDQAVEEMKRAHQLDPLSVWISMHLGWQYYIIRHYDQALQQVQDHTAGPDANGVGLWVSGLSHLQRGNLSEAIDVFKKGRRFDPYLGYAYAVSGNRAAAVKILRQLEEDSRQKYVPAYSIAILYVALGEREKAFEWLEKAYEDRSLLYAKVDPLLDPVRSDVRFQDLVRRMNFPP